MGAVLVAGGVMAAAPAHASSANVSALSSGARQYNITCLSASTCNQRAAGESDISFSRLGSLTKPLDVFYKVINGTAVDGVDFNTPATGEAIIPAGQTGADVFAPLVDEGIFGGSKAYTVQITSTSPSIPIAQGTSTLTIFGGNVPTDCSFTFISGTSQSLTCTSRPATQVWHLQTQCGDIFHQANGTEVTGNGTSTVTGCTVSAEVLTIDS
jgi:hypothetical protein